MRHLGLLACLVLANPGGSAQLPSNVEVDAIFERFYREDAPGMSVGVIVEGELVYARGYGMASLEHDVPNAADTIFRIGSTSKQFTAGCIALLSLRGELDLDADVREFFPEMWPHDPPVTVRHLVHHTSGVRDYISLWSLSGKSMKSYFTPEQSIESIERQRGLAFAPGERWQYSNSNYLLLGEIVQRVSGDSLAAFARRNLFEPLDMQHTSYQDLATRVVPGRAWGYSPAGKDTFVLDITVLDHVGDGSVFTTVRDLSRWDANFYDCNLPEGQAFLDLMHSEGLLNSGESTKYAFGLAIDRRKGLRTVRHGGAWVGYRAELLRFPEQRLSVICLANRSDVNPSALADQVADVFLADSYDEEPAPSEASPEPSGEAAPSDEAPPEPSSYTREQLQVLVGEYWSPELERGYRFVLRDDQLALDSGGRMPHRLEPAPGELRFGRGSYLYSFELSESGEVEAASMSLAGLGNFVLEPRGER